MVDLVAGQRDQAFGWGLASAFGGGEYGQEGAGEHGQHGPALPANPASELVLIESGQALAGLERFLDRPAASRCLHSSCSGTCSGA